MKPRGSQRHSRHCQRGHTTTNVAWFSTDLSTLEWALGQANSLTEQLIRGWLKAGPITSHKSIHTHSIVTCTCEEMSYSKSLNFHSPNKDSFSWNLFLVSNAINKFIFMTQSLLPGLIFNNCCQLPTGCVHLALAIFLLGWDVTFASWTNHIKLLLSESNTDQIDSFSWKFVFNQSKPCPLGVLNKLIFMTCSLLPSLPSLGHFLSWMRCHFCLMNKSYQIVALWV